MHPSVRCNACLIPTENHLHSSRRICLTLRREWVACATQRTRRIALQLRVWRSGAKRPLDVVCELTLSGLCFAAQLGLGQLPGRP